MEAHKCVMMRVIEFALYLGLIHILGNRVVYVKERYGVL